MAEAENSAGVTSFDVLFERFRVRLEVSALVPAPRRARGERELLSEHGLGR